MKSKKLNGFAIFTMTYGAAIGSGIFMLTGMGIASTGRSLPLAVVLAAVYMILSELYMLIISSFAPLKGGQFDQLSFVGTPVVKGAMAIMNLMSGAVIGGYATGVVDYLAVLVPGVLNYRKLVAVIIVAVFFLALSKGAGVLEKLQNAAVIFLIAALVLFAVVGLMKVDPTIATQTPLFLNGSSGFLGAAALMSWTCGGAIVMSVSMASETKNARHTIPKYTLLGMVAVVITYVAIAYVATHVLPIEKVANQGMEMVASAIFSKPLFWFFIIGGPIMGLVTTLIANIGYLRYPFEAMAEQNWLPKVFNYQLKNGYPIAMMIFTAVTTLITIIFDISMDNIAFLCTAPILPLYVYMSVKCLKLPKQYPELWKKSFFHMPYPLYVCLIALVVIAGIYYIYSYIFSVSSPIMYVLAAIFAVIMYGYSYLRVKTGAVDVKKMLDEQAKVVAEVQAQEAQGAVEN